MFALVSYLVLVGLSLAPACLLFLSGRVSVASMAAHLPDVSDPWCLYVLLPALLVVSLLWAVKSSSTLRSWRNNFAQAPLRSTLRFLRLSSYRASTSPRFCASFTRLHTLAEGFLVAPDHVVAHTQPPVQILPLSAFDVLPSGKRTRKAFNKRVRKLLALSDTHPIVLDDEPAPEVVLPSYSA